MMVSLGLERGKWQGVESHGSRMERLVALEQRFFLRLSCVALVVCGNVSDA